MGQIKLMSSLLFIALFVIAITSFAVNFANDNETNVNLADDSDYPTIKSDLEDDITIFYTDANTSTEAISKSTISAQTEATEGGTAFKVGPWTTMSMVKTSITSAYTKVFGPEFSIFFTAFFSLLAIIMGFYIYKTWAGRNPD